MQPYVFFLLSSLSLSATYSIVYFVVVIFVVISDIFFVISDIELDVFLLLSSLS